MAPLAEAGAVGRLELRLAAHQTCMLFGVSVPGQGRTTLTYPYTPSLDSFLRISEDIRKESILQIYFLDQKSFQSQFQVKKQTLKLKKKRIFC